MSLLRPTFATALDDSQQDDTSHPTDKYDAKVMAQKIYNKFGFNGSPGSGLLSKFLASLSKLWQRRFPESLWIPSTLLYWDILQCWKTTTTWQQDISGRLCKS
jgi:hypothetical protein